MFPIRNRYVRLYDDYGGCVSLRLTVDLLRIELDKYSKNIHLISSVDKERDNMVELLKQEWIKQGGLFYEFDSQVKLMVQNRFKYSDGKDQVPLLIQCDDMLDVYMLQKMQEKAQVQLIVISKEETDIPNFTYKLKHVNDRYWTMNGTTYKVPILLNKEMVVS